MQQVIFNEYDLNDFIEFFVRLYQADKQLESSLDQYELFRQWYATYLNHMDYGEIHPYDVMDDFIKALNN